MTFIQICFSQILTAFLQLLTYKVSRILSSTQLTGNRTYVSYNSEVIKLVISNTCLITP